MSDWPETDVLLKRFRDWLDETRAESRAPGASLSPRESNGEAGAAK